jgi:chromosome segregation ATPase
MSTSTSNTQTAAANQARHNTVQSMLNRIRATLDRMARDHTKITFAAVARHAAVSRTFLYQNPEARKLVEAAAAAVAGRHTQIQADQAAQVEAAWRERALNAEDALHQVTQEVSAQRNTIGQLLGKIRDLEQDIPEDGIQRILTQNTTLKRQIGQLASEKRQLEERLKGARDNARFLDKRVADLEAQLLSDNGLGPALTRVSQADSRRAAGGERDLGGGADAPERSDSPDATIDRLR